jgi:tetratricopeptide (TPR) repeat protein
MALSLSGRQIFLASPGGLGSERERLRRTVEHRNQTSAYWHGVAFIARGWEEVAGGLGRPQALINEIVDECDYTVVILADRWGSSPGDEDYSSGTEEEFMLSLDLRAGADKNLRDVLVLFRSIPDPQVADPGEELRNVLAFKKRLEDSKQILFDTFDSLDSLQEKFEKALVKWEKPWEDRVPLRIALPPTEEGPNIASVQDPLARALEFASTGQLVQAEMLFARAVQNDDPQALSDFARFLRRQGRLNDSHALNMRVVEDLAGRSALSTEEIGFLSVSLANIGVIARKQGKLADSARTLGEAVSVARRSSSALPGPLAYALDNLGHTQAQLGNTTAAEASFADAEQVRIEAGDEKGRLASLLNQGWMLTRTRRFDEALDRFGSAETLARNRNDEESLASALAGQGSCLQKSGRADLAIAPLTTAMEINTRLNSSDGISIAAGLLARAHLEVGDIEAASFAARKALESSQTSTNVTGLATANWVLAQIERAEQRPTTANQLFEEAASLAQRGGNTSLAVAIESDYARGTAT